MKSGVKRFRRFTAWPGQKAKSMIRRDFKVGIGTGKRMHGLPGEVAGKPSRVSQNSSRPPSPQAPTGQKPTFASRTEG